MLVRDQYDQAIADLSEAIRLDPPKHGFPFSERGKAYLSIGDYDRAIVDYTQAIRLDPKHVDPFVGRGKSV